MFHDDMYGHMPGHRPMATASLILGILSIVLCSVIYLALPFGALAILFAIMSHTEYTMTGKSKAGLVCGLCGILATIVVTVSAFRFVLTNPAARAYVDSYIQMYTGDETMTMENLFKSLLPNAEESGTSATDSIPGTEADEVSGQNTGADSDQAPGQNADTESDEAPIRLQQEGGTFL